MNSIKTIIKKAFLLMLLMALITPWRAHAQETLTVCDGTAPGTSTTTNSYIPIYGSYVDTQGATSEFIIPSTTAGMNELEGGTITKMSFYISNSPATWGSPTIQIYMGEVEGTTLNSLYGPTNSNVVVVSIRVLSNQQSVLEVELDEPYTYGGGNLLIGTYVQIKSSTYKATSFSGISASSGSSRYNTGSGSGTAQSFLPKTTFTYTPSAGGCGKPSTVTSENITSNSAFINWTGGSGTYNVEYKKTTSSEWISRITNYSENEIELTGLEAGTSYQARVQSVCEGNVVSGWMTTSFDTPCETVESFPFTETFDNLSTNGEIPMCWNNEEGTTTNENYRWCYNSSYGTGHSGKCVRFDSYSNSSGNTNFLKTPVMSLPQNQAMQLRFWYKNPNGGDFSVFISTDGGQTHETALATGLTNIADWTEKTIDLSDYKGESNVVIAFKGTSNYGNNDARIYLDDVNIELAPTCPKQNGLHVTALTSSSVTLDWTAGNSEQDHWDLFITTDASITPDANTSPTVTNTDQKPYTHAGLNDETVYFAFVRARCSDTDQSDWTDACRFVTPQVPVVVDGEHPYSNDFETNNGWLFVNGDRPNQWWYGSAANNTPNGSKAIYISNDGGVTNSYTSSSEAKGVVYATKAFTFAEGVYSFTYDWRAKGNQYYDFIRVALVPASYEIVATDILPTGLSATSLPNGWIALDGGSKLINSDVWNTQTADEIQVAAGDYKMVFVWRNLSGAANQPPAAIDNISISLLTCPRPTALTASNITGRTATLSWTENGTATNWVLQYATDNGFTENLVETNVSGTATTNLSGLAPETSYYARVKSVLDNEESSWSDVKDFTTTATCEKPTNWKYTPYSATAYSGGVEWEGNANGYNIAYRPTTDFDPSDETLQDVTRVTLGSVNAYTLQNLTPETKYYVYIQADCGSEDGTSSWSNRVIFSTLATCLEPKNLSSTATSTTITLSWTAGAEGQDAWDIRYKKSTDSDYTYIHLDNHPATSYTITDLSPVTTYSVNVRAWCDEDDQSKWGASSANQNYDQSVTTACGSLTMPYTCDFEGPLETSQSSSYPMPKCWTRKEYLGGYYGSYTYYPSVREASYSYPYAHGGNGESATSGKSMHFYKPNTSTDEAAILPEVDGQYVMSHLQISFWARLESSQTNKELSIGVMTNPSNISTFVEVATVTVKDANFQEYTAFFDNYTGEGRYIAIRFNASTTGYIFVDDITVDEAPSCRIPKDLDATTTYNSATLTWTAGGAETTWNLQYKKASDSNWSETIAIDETTYTLTGLQRATVYEARVQAICATDDQSDWAEVSFTTDCGIWPIDAQNALHENFENIDASDFPPICWEKFNHEMNGDSYWYLNANNGLGSGAAYSSWNEGYAFLVMPKMHIDGAANLSFDYLIGSGNYNESCSVVVSTEGMTYGDFSQTIWAADGDNLPSGRASATISLSDYDEKDIYVAFKFKGSGTSGCTWYIDNVHVYVGEIFTKNITAYNGNGGYYLIASPIGEVNPEHVVNMLANNYDLYYFDQSATDGLEWINYRSEANDGGGFSLQPGKGYLYANNGNVTLTFTGVPYNGNGQFDLTYDENASLKGWNLIGNPYSTTALLDKPYYRLNQGGYALNATTENTGISAMEGVFVQVTEANQKANFAVVTNNGESSKVAKLNINVTQGRATSSATTLDNAIVRFDNGSTLGKFQLNPNHTKVYIPQGGKDYAIVRSATQGEMPVNFKAEKNGSYTLNVSAENMGMHYLHLIDNMTGADIDLLADPSYSFEAKTTDYASRFRLVFDANENGASTSSATFAYYNGNNWVISNPSTVSGSEATLQVIDVMGRILRSETLNGNAEINLNQPAGIYMLRLVNGENVKTQKIVVR